MNRNDCSQAVREVADDIMAMRIRGAGRIARAASLALGCQAASWDGNDRDMFLSGLKVAARTLLSTRPTAVSLRNGIVLTLEGVLECPDVGSARALVIKASEEFRNRSEQAIPSMARHCSQLIPEDATVLTHCNSDAALTSIEAGFERGRVRRVICTESRPWRQGHITARRLAAKGIPVSLVVDSAVNLMMTDVDVVIVGADTITSEGDLFNKIGTSMIALSAGSHDVPFHSCAESYKFAPRDLRGDDISIEDRGPIEVADPLRPSDLPGVVLPNPVFDRTPVEHITSFVTEDGSIRPERAGDVIDGLFKGRTARAVYDWITGE